MCLCPKSVFNILVELYKIEHVCFFFNLILIGRLVGVHTSAESQVSGIPLAESQVAAWRSLAKPQVAAAETKIGRVPLAKPQISRTLIILATPLFKT